MAEQVPPATATDVGVVKAEDLTALRADLSKKMEGMEKSNQSLMAQLQAVANTYKAPPVEKAETKPTTIKDLIYDDPDKAAQIIKAEAKKEFLSDLQAQQAIQQKHQRVITDLYKDYPELRDYNDPLTLKAVEFYDRLPDEEKAHPMSYKLAVKEAAEELNVRPVTKRDKKDTEDNFTLSDTGEKISKRTGSRVSREVKEQTLKFAQLMGLDTDDPKVVDNLKKRAQRTNWGRWE